MSTYKIIILAPVFTEKSAGIVMLYRLFESMKRADPTTSLLNYQGIGNQFLITSTNGDIEPERLSGLFPEAIFIVPEVLCGSRLKNLRVARYYLNSLGVIAPAQANVEREFAITFNPKFCDHAKFQLHDYLGKVPIPENFAATQTNSRPINLTYFGKNTNLYRETFPLPTSLLLTREWPELRDHYIKLLELSEYLFTFDATSSTSLDAQAAGVKVVILDFSPDTESTYAEAHPTQPYLNQTNYQSETAIDEYISRCDNMFRSIRSHISQFDSKVIELHELLIEFFAHRDQ